MLRAAKENLYWINANETRFFFSLVKVFRLLEVFRKPVHNVLHISFSISILFWLIASTVFTPHFVTVTQWAEWFRNHILMKLLGPKGITLLQTVFSSDVKFWPFLVYFMGIFGVKVFKVFLKWIKICSIRQNRHLACQKSHFQTLFMHDTWIKQ